MPGFLRTVLFPQAYLLGPANLWFAGVVVRVAGVSLQLKEPSSIDMSTPSESPERARRTMQG